MFLCINKRKISKFAFENKHTQKNENRVEWEKHFICFLDEGKTVNLELIIRICML